MNFLACDPAELGTIVKFIKNGLIPIIQIGIPIILIVLGMLDLGKGVMAGKEDEIKAAQQLLIKRAISAVLVFFVVTIVSLLMNVVAGNLAGGDTTEEGGGAGNWADCWTNP